MNDRPAPPKSIDEQINAVLSTIRYSQDYIKKAEDEIGLHKKMITEARAQYLQLSEQRRKEQDAAALDN